MKKTKEEIEKKPKMPKVDYDVSSHSEYAQKEKRAQGMADKAKIDRRGVTFTQKDKDVIHKLLKDYGGNLARVADRMGTCRGVIHRIIEKDEVLKERLQQCRERLLDHLEETAHDKAIGGDSTLLMFLLKTQGRKRGYEQDSDKHIQSVTQAAFEFVLNRTKNPAE